MGNWDFSDDETFFFFAAAIGALAGFVAWYLPLTRVRAVGSESCKLTLALTPPACLAALLLVLQRWADPQYVVGKLDYTLLFTAGGAAWMWACGLITSFFGVSRRDDALERSNRAAAIAIAGLLGAVMSIYAWSNVGAGPTIWTTLFPAFVATAALFVLWAIVETFTHLSDAITIDRDVASGLRLAGWLIATSLILGRGMAGDWTNWQGTFDEFYRIAWPAVPLAIGMIVLHWFFRPTPLRPTPPAIVFGVLPALALILIAAIYVAAQGKPDIGVHVITYEQYMQGGGR